MLPKKDIIQNPGEVVICLPFRSGSIVGVLHKPNPNLINGKGILFLNGGHKAKYGPGRLYVYLARELCKHGFYVLRFDPPGFGDSKGLISPCTQTEIFNRIERGLFVSSAKVMAVFFREECKLHKLAAFGLCGGGLNSIQLTASMSIVDSAIGLNTPPKYSGFWGEKINSRISKFKSNSNESPQLHTGMLPPIRGQSNARFTRSTFMQFFMNFSCKEYLKKLVGRNWQLGRLKRKIYFHILSMLQGVEFGINGYFVTAAKKIKKCGKKVFICFSEKDFHLVEYNALLKDRFQFLLEDDIYIIPDANHILEEESHKKLLVEYINQVMKKM